MKRLTLAAMAALVSALVGACATQMAAPPQSLRGAAVPAADAVASERHWLGNRPGTQAGYTRTYSTQPPLIPHALENFDEVTLGDNQCLECHGPATYQKKEAPALSKSHFVGGTMAAGSMSQARYACVMCHVPQSDAPALVDNRFVGDRTVPSAAKPR